jgi:hypothetical protein
VPVSLNNNKMKNKLFFQFRHRGIYYEVHFYTNRPYYNVETNYVTDMTQILVEMSGGRVDGKHHMIPVGTGYTFRHPQDKHDTTKGRIAAVANFEPVLPLFWSREVADRIVERVLKCK